MAPRASPAEPARAPRHVFSVEWSKALVEPDAFASPPREVGGLSVEPKTGDVLVGTRDGQLRRVTPEGREVWREGLGAAATSPALIVDLPALGPAGQGLSAVVGAADGHVEVRSFLTGELRWSRPLAGQVLARPAYEAGVLYVGTDHDAVHALDAATGDARWVYRRSVGGDLSVRGGTGAAVRDGRVFAGFSDGAILALDALTGRILWESKAAGSARAGPRPRRFVDADATPVARRGAVFAARFAEGVVALDPATGRERWALPAPGVASLAEDRGLLFAAGAGGAWALDAEDGRVRWRVQVSQEREESVEEIVLAGPKKDELDADPRERAPSASDAVRVTPLEGVVERPTLTAGWALLPSPLGLTFALRQTGEPIRRFSPGSGFSSAAGAAGRALYALSDGGYLYKLRLDHPGEPPAEELP